MDFSNGANIMHRTVPVSAILFASMLALAGCASVAPPAVQQRAAAIHERNAAIDAAAQKIVTVSGATVPGHSQYTTLGHVRGYCENTPQGNPQAVEGDNLRQAAVRKYGNRVDAIINFNAIFVSTGAGTGHWQCMGDAVSFASAAPAPSAQ